MKLNDLLAKMEKLQVNSNKSNGPDDRFWKPTQDAAGNGVARIRFLPSKDADDLPFAKTYSHGFQNDQGRWFIEECPTTIGEQCPVCLENGKLWNSGIEDDKLIARARKRKTKFVANILVLEDPKNKENEGKVFLFAFGQKIFAKIMDKMKPAFEDMTPINPFDPEEGADLKLRICKVAGYTNYDKSEFVSQSSVEGKYSEDDLVDLKEFTAKSRFKSYTELAEKFNKFIGLANDTPVSKTAKVSDSDSDDEDMEFLKKTVAAKKAEADVSKPAAKKPASKVDDDDDDLEYFKKLANEVD